VAGRFGSRAALRFLGLATADPVDLFTQVDQSVKEGADFAGAHRTSLQAGPKPLGQRHTSAFSLALQLALEFWGDSHRQSRPFRLTPAMDTADFLDSCSGNL